MRKAIDAVFMLLAVLLGIGLGALIDSQRAPDKPKSSIAGAR